MSDTKFKKGDLVRVRYNFPNSIEQTIAQGDLGLIVNREGDIPQVFLFRSRKKMYLSNHEYTIVNKKMGDR